MRYDFVFLCIYDGMKFSDRIRQTRHVCLDGECKCFSSVFIVRLLLCGIWQIWVTNVCVSSNETVVVASNDNVTQKWHKIKRIFIMSLLVAALFLSMIIFTVDELYLFKFVYWIDTFIGVDCSHFIIGVWIL